MTFRPFFPLRALALLGSACLGCAPAATGPPASADAGRGLAGTSWRLESLGGSGVLERVDATLEFSEDGKVSGRASCNRFSGTVEISGDSVKFGPLAATKMSCGDAVDAQEIKYLAALQDAERFELDGPTLLVYSRAIDRPLRFSRR